ncbi:hypothetical protein VTL71DRAFT_7255 [Oculimacula yallundae]|uniref:Uncharacterized protein n=1 Tax=Oculimacula yallundae TaxID=86028 RepID=A0ABR4BX03_9HELO
MAAELLNKLKDDKDFTERLRSSSMIEIKCPARITRLHAHRRDITVRLPEVIGCSLSGRISKAVGTGENIRRVFNIEELMGGNEAYLSFECQLEHGYVLDYLTWFVQWVYSSKLEYRKDLRFFEMWAFASAIECPLLQNEAMAMLGRDALWRSKVSLEEKRRQYYFANDTFVNTILYWRSLARIQDENENDDIPYVRVAAFKEDGQIDLSYWEDKKDMLFLLDCAAFFGPDDERVREVVAEDDGDLTFLIMKRMIQLAKAGGEMCPWDAQNIGRYFVAERIFQSTPKDATMMPPPSNKRPLPLSSLGSGSPSIANSKRIKQGHEKEVLVKQSPTSAKSLSDVSATLVGEDEELNKPNGKS